MEKERKTRKSRQWNPLTKAIRAYQTKVNDVHREIEQYAKTGRSGKIIMPSYVKDVISLLAEEITQRIPELHVSVSEQVEIFGADIGYFKVSAGGQIIGGFSYPGPGIHYIHFTVFANGKPWGKPIEIEKMPQLAKVISKLVEFIGPCNIDCDGN